MGEAAHDPIGAMFWRGTSARSSARAVGHAWTKFERMDDGSVVIEINGKQAMRLSIKYRDDGPYLHIEDSPNASGETMGECTRAANMAIRYAEILDAHNGLGELLNSARTFLITPEERERARASLTSPEQRQP